MSRRARRGGGIEKPKASIDMNSLIDLTFLLLVTFMLTIPAVEQGVDVMLPRAKVDVEQHKTKTEKHTVTQDATGRIFLDNRPVTLEALEGELTALVKQKPEAGVLYRGDESLAYSAVMEVIECIYKCRPRGFALMRKK